MSPTLYVSLVLVVLGTVLLAMFTIGVFLALMAAVWAIERLRTRV